MLNQNSKNSITTVNNSRRELLVTLGRSVLFLFMAGVTGFLFRRRRCWDADDVTYTQLPCQDCRQLKGCGRPTAEVYRTNRSNDQNSG